jgi:hypothetical protein
MAKRREHLREQRVLAGVSSNYNYTLREDSGESEDDLRDAQDRAADLMARAFKGLGRKTDKYGGGWSSQVNIEVPEAPRDDGRPQNFDFSIGGQWFPKGGYNFYVKLQGPSFDHSPVVISAHRNASKVFHQMLSKFKKFGRATIPVDKAGDTVKLWIDIPDDKINTALKDLPKAVADMAKPIDTALKKGAK